MTSGSFQSTPISSIIVNREERQRRDLNNIDELAESLNRIGLIHPLVITREHILVAGERRITAAKALGWTAISTQFVDEADPVELEIIELEENVRREDLSWVDRCAAVERYHKLRKIQEPNHGIADTASELGISRASISGQISVAAEVKRNPLVAKAEKYSTALNIVQREQSRKIESLKTDTKLFEDEVPSPEPTKPAIPLLNEDFHLWSQAYTGQRFNLIHCDFPYGVNMHKSGQGANQEFGSYADEKDLYWALLGTLKAAMENVVADSAHLIFWFSMDWYTETKALLEEMGWKVSPFPLVWLKSDNTGIIPDAQRGPRRIYETAFFGSRGDRLLTGSGAKANAFSHPGKDKSIHMNEKPVPMLQHFLSMIVDEYSFVLDPTAGSANALKAARNLGAGKVLGLERDKEFFDRAVEAWND